MTRAELEQTYDRVRKLEGFQSDPWTDLNLCHFRPRHLLLANGIENFLDGRRVVVADIGCQNGFFLRLVSHLGFRQFVALDYFPLPAERSFLSGLDGVRWEKANFNEPGALRMLGDASVDCVVSTEVFEHLFNHPSSHLHECWRVLRTGGLLLLTTPNPATFANAVRLALGRPISWGAVAFAETPKITPGGLPAALWDVHFREYAQPELRAIINNLSGVEVCAAGFVATEAALTESWPRRLGKAVQWRMRLGSWRPLCTTQYWILRRRGS